jgi:PEGA domain
MWGSLRISAVLAFVGLAALREPGALAQGAAEVEKLLREGVALRRQQKEERALPFFQKAYELGRSPRTAGQLGLAEMALGYWIDADRHLGEALEASDHPWVARNVRTLRQVQASARNYIGELVIDGTPVGAEVSVNGRPVGTLPLPVRMAKGPVEVTVRAPGYQTSTQSVLVPSAKRRQITIALAKEMEGAPPPPGILPAVGEPPGPVDLPPPVPRAQEPGGWTRSWMGLVSLGAATAAAVGAVRETVVWQRKRVEFNNLLVPPPDDPTEMDRRKWLPCDRDLPNRGGGGCADVYADSRRAETFAIVGYVVTGVLLTTSIMLFASSRYAASSQTTFRCLPAVRSTMACQLAF